MSPCKVNHKSNQKWLDEILAKASIMPTLIEVKALKVLSAMDGHGGNSHGN